jgi:hypothetical protein
MMSVKLRRQLKRRSMMQRPILKKLIWRLSKPLLNLRKSQWRLVRKLKKNVSRLKKMLRR